MSPVTEERIAHYEASQFDEDYLEHYGTPRRSGRYPYGSGEDPYQHGEDFLGRIEKMRKSGFTYDDPETGKKYTGDTAIAKSMGLSTTQFRTEIGLAKDERRMLQVATIRRLQEKEGITSPTELGKRMGINESSVRSLMDPNAQARMEKAQNTAKFLKEQVDEKKMIDIGANTALQLGISKEKLDQAVYLLERDGYKVYKGGIPQPTNIGQQTNQKVLCVPGTQHKEIYQFDKVKTLEEYTSHNDGASFTKFEYPASMSSKRLMVRYKEDGGELKDGIVELRRGVADLSLGDARYSQVRILVDDKKYIKGMAVYGEDKDFPPGVDVIFNTNKGASKGKLGVLKDIKEDPDNPFGSLIKPNGQSYYDDPKGKYTDPLTGKKQSLSLINKRADEGDWDEWADALPSQFLGKQSLSMAKKQLNIAKADKQAEYESICEINNPTIKKHYLKQFADECDAAAVNLKAAALPGQKYHVIIPVNSLKDTEVYAPNYTDGTKLALIRYPHGGTFEIPILTVNNKHAPARKLIGNDVVDAVCINKKNADRLSGADFDGDTVMCIPTHDRGGKVKITNRDELDGLKGFDPKMVYAYSDEDIKSGKARLMTKKGTQTEMGKISNLITDMTIAGADDKELERAVRHSMVVIDAEKHKLNYKQSEIDNNITALKKDYQMKDNGRYGGASTILSRAKGEVSVDKRQGTPKINQKGKSWYDPSKPEGTLVYKTADDLYYTYTTKTGKVVTKARQQRSTRMMEETDAYNLVSPAKHPMEMVYADYANSMKSMAQTARMEMLNTGKIAYSKAAKDTYREEVDSLDRKLTNALLNTGRERAALRLANAEIQSKVAARKEAGLPDMSNDELKKLNQQAVTSSRAKVGSVARRDRNINITDKEWEAIQAGAVSETTLKKILNNSDPDRLRELATPRPSKTLSSAQVNRMKALSGSHTLAQIAEIYGVSTSTVSKYLKGGN